MLSAAARARYLKGCPGLTQAAIHKLISMEDCTEIGHLQKIPSGKGSTTTQSNQGHKANAIEHTKVSLEATTIPTQELGNVKTKQVFMTVRLADGFIASD